MALPFRFLALSLWKKSGIAGLFPQTAIKTSGFAGGFDLNHINRRAKRTLRSLVTHSSTFSAIGKDGVG